MGGGSVPVSRAMVATTTHSSSSSSNSMDRLRGALPTCQVIDAEHKAEDLQWWCICGVFGRVGASYSLAAQARSILLSLQAYKSPPAQPPSGSPASPLINRSSTSTTHQQSGGDVDGSELQVVHRCIAVHAAGAQAAPGPCLGHLGPRRLQADLEGVELGVAHEGCAPVVGQLRLQEALLVRAATVMGMA